jgi:hypothetical protein
MIVHPAGRAASSCACRGTRTIWSLDGGGGDGAAAADGDLAVRNFDRSTAGFQFVEKFAWIPGFNIEYTSASTASASPWCC